MKSILHPLWKMVHNQIKATDSWRDHYRLGISGSGDGKVILTNSEDAFILFTTSTSGGQTEVLAHESECEFIGLPGTVAMGVRPASSSASEGLVTIREAGML